MTLSLALILIVEIMLGLTALWFISRWVFKLSPPENEDTISTRYLESERMQRLDIKLIECSKELSLNEIRESVLDLLADFSTRKAMSRKMENLFKGDGAYRICRELLTFNQG